MVDSFGKTVGSSLVRLKRFQDSAASFQEALQAWRQGRKPYPGSPKTKLGPLVGSGILAPWIILKTSHFVWSTGLPGHSFVAENLVFF